MHQERLTIATISENAPHLISATIDWFSQTLHHIYNFVFSKGLAELQEDHASDIWYWSPSDGLDDLFSIQQELDTTGSCQLYFGSRNGGTVLYMPFGPMQMHQNQMQFRHRHQDIARLGKQS